MSISSISSNFMFSNVATKTKSGIINMNIVTRPLKAPIKDPPNRSNKVRRFLGLIFTLLSTSTSSFMTFTTLYFGYKRFSMP